MTGEQEALQVLGSPVTSPKALRKFLKPNQSQATSNRDLLKSVPLSKATKMKLAEEELVLVMEEEAQEEEEGEGVLWNGKGSSTCQR